MEKYIFLISHGTWKIKYDVDFQFGVNNNNSSHCSNCTLSVADELFSLIPVISYVPALDR